MSPFVDLYLAPTQQAKRELIRLGVSAGRIAVTGIPIHPRHARPPSRGEAARELGLDPARQTLLVAGGTKGLGPIRDIAPRLLESNAKLQMVAVCGSNEELRSWFESKAERFKKRLVVLGFTDQMPACLAASDMLVGKAGGVTAAEALAAGVPMAILSPLPGQEERNSVYLTEQGAALRADDQSDLIASVRRILSDPKRLNAMKATAARLGRRDSAQKACKEILKIVR
ncbi:MAG: glycosyltransferase [Elusimicrobia bacterium]|nr:glycosyltransferase [Elusimicrobiota bacterium]